MIIPIVNSIIHNTFKVSYIKSKWNFGPLRSRLMKLVFTWAKLRTTAKDILTTTSSYGWPRPIVIRWGRAKLGSEAKKSNALKADGPQIDQVAKTWYPGDIRVLSGLFFLLFGANFSDWSLEDHPIASDNRLQFVWRCFLLPLTPTVEKFL